VLTPGSKNLLLRALALVDGGRRRSSFPDPATRIYRSLVEFIGAKAVSLPRAAPGERLPAPMSMSWPRSINAPDADACGQLAAESDWRHPHPSGLRGPSLAWLSSTNLIVLSDEIYNRAELSDRRFTWSL